MARCDRNCFECPFKDCILSGNEILNPKRTNEQILAYQRKRYKIRKMREKERKSS